MERLVQNEILNLEVLESRLEMESVAALTTNMASAMPCHCTILTNPKPN